MTGWREMRELIAADRARLLAYFGATEPLWLQPGHIAAVLHRLAHHLHSSGWRRLAWVVRVFNIELTGADIDPASRIGRGLLLPNPQAITIRGTLGDNCTVMAHTSIGWVVAPATPDERGIAGRFLRGPVLGCNVVLEPGALVLGAVRIGDGVQIGARCLVTTDLGDATEVLPLEWRAVRH
jgi:serine O-acetyltransferase